MIRSNVTPDHTLTMRNVSRRLRAVVPAAGCLSLHERGNPPPDDPAFVVDDCNIVVTRLTPR